MGVIWVTVLVMASAIFKLEAAPAVKYDQRQEGDVNVRADLENFVILIIPTTGGNSLGLLDLLKKAMPAKGELSAATKTKLIKPLGLTSTMGSTNEAEDNQHFIESKTAPYHVDISRTRSHLAKLHSQLKVAEGANGEVLIAHSPVVTLTKDTDRDKQDSQPRAARSIVINQNDDVQALILTSDIAVDVKKENDDLSKAEKKESNRGELLLLGAEVQCAYDQKRDAQGICQFVKS